MLVCWLSFAIVSPSHIISLLSSLLLSLSLPTPFFSLTPLLTHPHTQVLAFDIECEKAPLKFPNAENDRIYMISYMTPGQGFLIINREIVSQDVSDFEYTPKPQYPGPFTVMHEANEEGLLRRFLSHVQELRPHVIVTYNGDFFDWPYVDARCGKYANLSVYQSLGIKSNGGTGRGVGVQEGEYSGRCMVHLDAFCWVKRDSYLPQVGGVGDGMEGCRGYV